MGLCGVESVASSFPRVRADTGISILVVGVFGEEIEMVVP